MSVDKAKWPFRLWLAFFICIYDWFLDHRIHLRYSVTVSDPHNIKDGFLLASVSVKPEDSDPRFNYIR